MSGQPATHASAPGKIILLGEHAVVYGRPAIAVPVWEVQARASIHTAPPGTGCHIHAHDTQEEIRLCAAPATHPLALVVRLALAQIGAPPDPDWRIHLRSEIPMASGLGSGAAISTALVRAIFSHAGHAASAQTVSELVYESEKVHHGTPSGIDNTVVAYGMPIWYVKGQEPERFQPGAPFTIVIADSGIASPTKETVGDVRRAWQQDPTRLNALFDEVGEIVRRARACMESAEPSALGPLLVQNQAVLEALGVSSPRLRRLIDAAIGAGALGAKLSGGGRGGNIIALVNAEAAVAVANALMAAGAVRVIRTRVTPTQPD